MANITVIAKSGINPSNELRHDFEIDVLENAMGRVLVVDPPTFGDGSKGSSKAVVEIDAEITGLADKIQETTLCLWPAADRTLRCDVTKKGTKTKVPTTIKTDGGPLPSGQSRDLLAELWAHARGIEDMIDAARRKLWDDERVQAETTARERIPAGHVELRFIGSEADGWIQKYSDPAGRILRSPRITGEWNRMAWMTPEDHAAAVAVHDEERRGEAERAKQASKAADAHREELAKPVPADALAAYKRYRGDSEAAWEDEDETASILINRYAEAIESQGLAQPGPAVIKRLLRSDEIPVAEY